MSVTLFHRGLDPKGKRRLTSNLVWEDRIEDLSFLNLLFTTHLSISPIPKFIPPQIHNLPNRNLSIGLKRKKNSSHSSPIAQPISPSIPTMPPHWLRPSNPFIYLPISFILFNVTLAFFPDPPVLQEAQARNRELARKRSEEEYGKKIEAYVEQYERENQKLFDREKWDDEEDGRRDRE